jgi:hypothetical protein
MQKNEIGTLPHTICRNDSKWTKYLNLRAKIIKLLEESIEVNLHGLGLAIDS